MIYFQSTALKASTMNDSDIITKIGCDLATLSSYPYISRNIKYFHFYFNMYMYNLEDFQWQCTTMVYAWCLFCDNVLSLRHQDCSEF